MRPCVFNFVCCLGSTDAMLMINLGHQLADTSTGDSNRCSVDRTTGEESCVELLRYQLQHS